MIARNALVGHTGLVGGNLAAKRDYDVQVNSSNPHALEGAFGRVVFSAARAEKWRANQDPEADSAHVAELEAMLAGFTCEQLVLVSTVDVYPQPIGVDEGTAIEVGQQSAYGAHRLRLERTALRLHPRVLVIRLPGLFGPGLKKNVLHDLMHRHRLEHIQPRSVFQYYDLRRFADDVDLAVEAGVELANLATEPIETGRVMREVFELEPRPSDSPVVRYDMRTVHSAVFGGRGDYVVSADAVIEGIRSFVADGVQA